MARKPRTKKEKDKQLRKDRIKRWWRIYAIDMFIYLAAGVASTVIGHLVITQWHVLGFLALIAILAVAMKLIPSADWRKGLVASVNMLALVAVAHLWFSGRFLNDGGSLWFWVKSIPQSLEHSLWGTAFLGLWWVFFKLYLGAFLGIYLFFGLFLVNYPNFGVFNLWGSAPWRLWVRAGLHAKLGRIQPLIFVRTFTRKIRGDDGKVKEERVIKFYWDLEMIGVVDGHNRTAEEDLIKVFKMDDKEKRYDALSTNWVMSAGSLAAGAVTAKLDTGMGVEARLIADITAAVSNPIVFLKQSVEIQKKWWVGIKNELEETHREIVNHIPLRVYMKIDAMSLMWASVDNIISFVFAYLKNNSYDRDPNIMTEAEIRNLWKEFRAAFSIPQKSDTMGADGQYSSELTRQKLLEVAKKKVKLPPEPILSPKGKFVLDANRKKTYKPSVLVRNERSESLVNVARPYGLDLLALRIIDLDIPEELKKQIEKTAVNAQKLEAERLAGVALYEKAWATVDKMQGTEVQKAEWVLELVRMFVASDTLTAKDKILVSGPSGLEGMLRSVMSGNK